MARAVAARRPASGGRWGGRPNAQVELPSITLPGGNEARMRSVPALGEHTGALPRAVGMTDYDVAVGRRDGATA